ncbi:hypothetical protein K5549_006167 [Capra hircus]|uniref:Uncharacterized protein n=1 Tax=Capra hircus TaxID=9925 RepID=A0A452DVR9_CAPHI|nr:hypothetical protein K5549_006167 [Capra hircus]
MPIGVPRVGGSPIGGPMGGLIPGGGAIIPRKKNGGVARPTGVGAVPRPVGAPAMLAVAATAAAATVPLPYGPPTPRTGPANPAGAWGIGTPAGTPLPAALPTPGPPAAPASGTRAMPFSPRNNTRPKTRFSSRPHCPNPKWPYLIFLNSSQSQRIKFICLSKALKVPMKIRPSCRIHLIL